jgi:hypothetical protein
MKVNIVFTLILLLAASSGQSQTRRPVHAAVPPAASKPRVYVALFTANGSVEPATITRITDDFETRLFANHCYDLVERKDIDDLLKQLRGESQLYSIRDFDSRVRDLLKFEHATAVVFGQIDDDVRSGQIVLRVKTESFDSKLLGKGHSSMNRGLINDQSSRVGLVTSALKELCPMTSPNTGEGSVEPPNPPSTNFNTVVDGFLIELNGCQKGGTTSVECSMTITNQRPDDRTLGINTDSSIIDAAGLTQRTTFFQIGSSKIWGCCAATELLTRVKVKANITFGGVEAGVTRIGRLRLSFYSNNTPFKVDFRDVPLQLR